MMDTFIGNVKKIAQSGCSYTVEVTPNDELIPHIDEVKRYVWIIWSTLPCDNSQR